MAAVVVVVVVVAEAAVVVAVEEEEVEVVAAVVFMVLVLVLVPVAVAITVAATRCSKSSQSNGALGAVYSHAQDRTRPASHQEPESTRVWGLGFGTSRGLVVSLNRSAAKSAWLGRGGGVLPVA